MEESRIPAPCPVCGPTLPPGPGAVVQDPLLTTPDARLRALAVGAGIQVFDDLKGDGGDGIGGAAAVVFDDDGQAHRLVWVAEGLADELRADVLAFAIALVADPDDPVGRTPAGRVGIGSDRLPAAGDGVGHVAWHLAAACGRTSPSTTFGVRSLPEL